MNLNSSKSEHNEEPVVIINLWTLSNHFSPNLRDKLLGDRLNEIRAEFENFLINLRDNGAVLIFTFKKSRSKEWDFSANSEADYENGCEILDVISVLKKSDDIIRHFATKPEYFFPKNRAILTVLAQTAAKYGILSGLDSVDCKPSTVHVRLANKEKAMAMIGIDTYYMFYEGPWKIWSDRHLDMKTMTIREFNKEFVLNKMQLDVEKAPLFVALAGGLYSDEETIKKMIKFFEPSWRKKIFENVCEYVNRQKFPLSDETLLEMIREIFGTADHRILNEFKRTIDLMNPEKIKFEPTIVEACENEFLNYANQILSNGTINIPITFMDLR